MNEQVRKNMLEQADMAHFIGAFIQIGVPIMVTFKIAADNFPTYEMEPTYSRRISTSRPIY